MFLKSANPHLIAVMQKIGEGLKNRKAEEDCYKTKSNPVNSNKSYGVLTIRYFLL